MLESKCTDEEKAKGYDLGDYLIDQIKKLRAMVQSEEIQIIKPPEPQKE